MDTLVIDNLELEASVGCYASEKEKTQPLLITLEVTYDAERACQTDHVEDTLDYTLVMETINAMVEKQHYHLVERLGEVICHALISRYPIIESISISLSKKLIYKNATKVGVQLHRNRTHYRIRQA